MSFVVVKGELCSCSCNCVSVMVENRGEKRYIWREWRKICHKKFWCAVVLLYLSLALAQAKMEKFWRMT